jgi:hypothetical protein
VDPIPKMVIATTAAHRKGELEVGSAEEIDGLISQLIIAKAGILGAQSAIGARGATDAASEGGVLFSATGEDESGPCMMAGCGHGYDDHALDLERGDRLYCQRCECRRFLSAEAMRADPAAIPAADGEHVTCPACGFRDGRHNPAGCRRLEHLQRVGKRVQALSEPAAAEHPFDAGEGSRELSGPGRGLLTAAVAKDDARGMAELTVPRTSEMVPLDEAMPWAAQPAEACGWTGPDGDHCLLKPHGPRVAHAAPIGAGSMRRWPALRSVTA